MIDKIIKYQFIHNAIHSKDFILYFFINIDNKVIGNLKMDPYGIDFYYNVNYQLNKKLLLSKFKDYSGKFNIAKNILQPKGVLVRHQEKIIELYKVKQLIKLI